MSSGKPPQLREIAETPENPGTRRAAGRLAWVFGTPAGKASPGAGLKWPRQFGPAEEKRCYAVVSKARFLAAALMGIGAVLFLTAATGCGDGEEGTYSAPEPHLAEGDILPIRGRLPADSREKPVADLPWSRCALLTGGEGEDAECAAIRVPLRWDAPAGRTIELSVKRTRFVSNPRGQIWLLAGGPGAPATGFEAYVAEDSTSGDAPTFQEIAPDLEVYLLDHRGTGASTRLGCPVQEAETSDESSAIALDEWAGCRDYLVQEWGADLEGFTMTQAARDLGELIGRTRHGQEPVYIYSVSYGTLWAQRYLQIFPEQSSGVVLDSPCAPGACQFGLGFDQGFDRVGRRLMDRCGQDPECSEVLGPDPVRTLEDTAAALEAGYCPELDLSRARFRHMLALMLAIWPFRDLVPAAVNRVRNCDVDAVAELERVLRYLRISSDAEGFSPVLFEHIVQAEFLESEPPLEDAVARNLESLLFSTDLGLEVARVHSIGWPTPLPDAWFQQFPVTQTPLLVLSGGLDPQTPIEVVAPLIANLRGQFQQSVLVPLSPHSILQQSPIDLDADGSIRTCGQELIAQFLANPQGAVDDSCVARVSPLSFSYDALSSLLFGDSTTWGRIP